MNIGELKLRINCKKVVLNDYLGSYLLNGTNHSHREYIKVLDSYNGLIVRYRTKLLFKLIGLENDLMVSRMMYHLESNSENYERIEHFTKEIFYLKCKLERNVEIKKV